MNALLQKLNHLFERLPDTVRRYRLLVWAGFFFLVPFVGFGMQWLEIDMTMDSFFRQNDPVKIMYDRFKDGFGSDEVIYIVYEPRDGDVFSGTSLRAVKRLQEEIVTAAGGTGDGPSPLEHITEVRTIVNASYLEVQRDTLTSRDFVQRLPRTPAEREDLRERALAHEEYPLFYVSPDSRYGGITIRTDFGTVLAGPQRLEAADGFLSGDEQAASDLVAEDDVGGLTYRRTTMQEYSDFVRDLNQIIGKSEYTSALKFHPVGSPVVMAFFNDVLIAELAYLFSGGMLLITVVLLILFRSLSGVVWPVAIVTCTTIVTVGLMGWLGIKMSMMISVLLMLLLVVGVADAVHILSGYLFFRGNGLDHGNALRAVFRKSGLACLITSVTTAIGMLSLLLVPIPPVRNFGFSAAVGVLLAFVLTVMVLPLMLDLWPPIRTGGSGASPQPRQSAPLVQRFLRTIEPLSYRYPLFMSGVFLLIFVVAGYGISRIKVDSNLVQIIKEGSVIREDHDLVDRIMGGTQSMEIFLDFKAPDALKDPRVMNAMDQIQRFLEQEHADFVVKTESLVNVAKDSYRALNENRQAMYRIPQDRPVLAQTLLLFDLASPSDREQLVSDDYSRGRISVRLLNYGSDAYLAFFDAVGRQMGTIFAPLEEAYPDLETGVTGSLALMMRMADYISRSQMRSFGLALAVVTLLLFLVFGSTKAGLVAMIANVFPVALTFGTMGLVGFPLDADTLIIAPIVIGIAVDDTIHFVTHYRAEVLERGDIIASIKATLREVGQAITFTTVIIVLGLLILVTSQHQGMAHFGYLAAVAFFSALLADLLLLPSLAVLLGIRFGEGASSDTEMKELNP
jgi:predicted RND superfamily exporter protein